MKEDVEQRGVQANRAGAAAAGWKGGGGGGLGGGGGGGAERDKEIDRWIDG